MLHLTINATLSLVKNSNYNDNISTLSTDAFYYNGHSFIRLSSLIKTWMCCAEFRM